MIEFLLQTLSKVATTIGLYFPGDPLFASKDEEGSPLQRSTLGWAHPIRDADNKIVEYLQQFNLIKTTKFTGEWAASVGIPDNIYPLSSDNDTLRNFVLCKLRSNGTQTLQDFLDVAECLNIPNIVIEQDASEEFVVNIFGDDIASETQPSLSVPFDLLAGEPLIAKVFNSLKPIHVEFRYFDANPIIPPQSIPFDLIP